MAKDPIQRPRDQAVQETVTQENILLDAVERIGRIRDGRVSVHLHLSRLKPQNRQEGYLRVAARMLEPMISAYRGQLFLLTNSDIVFLVNQPNIGDLRDQIHRLRGLFAKDPLTSADSGDGVDLFCSIYDLTFDYEIFLASVRQLTAEARAQKNAPHGGHELRPLDANSLSVVLERLGSIDATQFIRRQSAISLAGGDAASGHAGVIFQEFFVGMTDLQRALAPDVSLFANRWMFLHLISTLDKRVLFALQRLRLTHYPPALHLNLTISTLVDPAFQAFEASRPPGLNIGVELQILDVLADSRAFFAARALLREKGYPLVIDGLDETTLKFMDVKRTDADLYKVEWSPELVHHDRETALLHSIRGIDPAKLLLARCDSETAIMWGLEHGMEKFQGRYVEAMLAATTMAVCDKSSACTLAQCTQRHAVIAGPLRSNDCTNNLMLDTPPPMRAPQRRAARK